MDPSLTSGGIIATIGIGTVFFALVTLIALITLISRLSPPPAADDTNSAAAAPEASPQASADSESAQAGEPEAPEIDYQQIALAAYAHHRRTTTRVKSNSQATSWDAAGRIRELNQRRTGTSWS